jgi:glycosyltransferase involved in cell wall biosynthesis
MNKVLVITYYWPPSGGAGVQRWLKFAKCLPDFGWEPIILTIDQEYAAYPVTDNSLLSDLPSSVKVYKTPATDYFSIYRKDRSKIPTAGFANNTDNSFKGKILRFIRGNFFIPDPRRGWNNFAFKKACSLIEREGINRVITTSPPHSTQLIGLKLKKKYPAIKWIADLRDPWTDIYYYEQFYPTFLSRKIDLYYEKTVLEKADQIITIGSSLKDLLSSKVNGIADKIEIITNGYDEDDFNGLVSTNPDKLTISYIGTLSDDYPINGFLEALLRIKDLGISFVLKFAGIVAPKQRDLIILKLGESSVVFLQYITHSEAVTHMMNSTYLLLIIPDHRGNKSIITGKLFEYIAAGKPIICLGPIEGDAADIIKTVGAGETFRYDDSRSISDYLKQPLNSLSQSIQNKKIKYSRKELTGKIFEILKF